MSFRWELGGAEKDDYLTKYMIVYKGNDIDIIRAIKASMDSLIPHSKSTLSYIFAKPLAILKLTGYDGTEEEIHIAHCSFFVGKKRVANLAFYSPELAGIVKDIFEAFPENRDLLMSEDLFSTLAKGGNIKYIIDPTARDELVERLQNARRLLRQKRAIN